ncbi:ABC transporter ATP-binding protein [Roseospira visakhapatnamensis]|uniref:Iron complex transport system ATP-binding protein n=1 Tax=Roseospira visakhapatnamensis TaxID=390880 RepID=A0A7W6REL5_9PROT|nr:ABC transporter ATP-binding protein [Roseospira visakhapatnamensis]MBB4266503.1 iron complex transport system ATP-binding protein [Roseospira visakhapatnamensis]
MSGLEITSLSVRIGARRLVDAASLEARRGMITGVIGPNGAGKSTLLRAVAGVVPHTGTLRLDGVPLPRPGGRARARLIGYLPQDHGVHWPVSVRRMVELGRLPHLGPWRSLSGADTEIVEAALARTDSAGLADAAVPTLSGGERARAMLARVLATRTPVLLADEPAAALDPAHQVGVMTVLREEADTNQRVIVVVLHDLSLAARVCDRLVLMEAGRVIRAGAAETVLGATDLERVYGVAFSRGHVDAMPVVTPVIRPPSGGGGGGWIDRDAGGA